MHESNDSKKRANVALTITALIFVASFLAAVVFSDGGAYGLAIAAFIAGFGLYCVEYLGLKVGGSQITLERQIHKAEVENQRLKDATEALLRSYYVLLDSTHYVTMGGPSIAHLKMIDECLAPVRDLFPDGLQEEMLEKAATLVKQYSEAEATMTPLQRQQVSGLL